MDRLPIWRFVMVCVCSGVLGTLGAAAIATFVFHLPRTGPWGIQRWVAYGISYTVFYTGSALLGRHLRMRRRQREAQPGPPLA